MPLHTRTPRPWMAVVATIACAGQAFGASTAVPAVEPNAILDTGTYEAPNGDTFAVTKAIVDGVRTMTYERDGVVYTPETLAAYEAANPVPVIDSALLDRAKALPPGALLRVVVRARSNPWPAAVRAAREAHAPAIEAMGEEIRAIHASIRPEGSFSPEQEREWVDRGGAPAALTPAQEARVLELNEAIEAEGLLAREEAKAAVALAAAKDQQALAAAVAAVGGKVEASVLTINGVSALVPASALAALANEPAVRRIFEEEEGGPSLDQTAESLGADDFWADGFTAQTWDVAILDVEGVQINHPALVGQNWTLFPGLPAVSTGDGHGTAVAGIIGSTDPTYRGLAFGLDRILYGRGGVGVTHADWLATSGPDDPEAFNLSWHYGVHSADYTYDGAKFIDALVDDFSLTYCIAAGNFGPGANTLSNPNTSFNAISVANVRFQGTVTRTDDDITDSSSRGPVLVSGRRKPDIAAPGQGVETCNDGWATGGDWTGFGGTSAASPHVCGGALLVGNQRGSDNPLPIKAILLNTADTWTDGGTLGSTADDGPAGGSAWNATFGWGYMDLAEANFNAPHAVVSTIDDGVTPAGPNHRFYKGRMFANEKATLVWNRHAVYNDADAPDIIAPLTDLDLRLYDQENGASVDSSFTIVNNVEQVGATSTIDAVVKVSCYSPISPLAGTTESYALALEEGFVPATGPALSSVLADDTASPGVNRVIRVIVGNSGDLPAHNVTVNLGAMPSGWTLVAGADTQNIGTIGSGGFLNLGVAEWTVMAPCSISSADFTWSVTSNSYGESFADSGTGTIAIEAAAQLASDVPVNDDEVTKTWRYTHVSSEWAAVAVSTPSSDHDVRIDQSQCMTSPIVSSAYGGTVTDFVVADGRTYGNASQYANVYFGDNTAYTIEFEQAFDIAADNLAGVTFAVAEPIELFEVPLVAGARYRIVLDPTGGNTDATLAVFAAGRDFGSRGTADLRISSAGPGLGINAPFTPDTTGSHAIVIANDNRSAGTFGLRVTCLADFDGDGAVAVPDIFAFLSAWFAGDAAADFDASGGAPIVPDIFAFLSAWFAGC